MEEEPGEILTIDVLADRLRIPRSPIHGLAHEGSSPCQKPERHWRFRHKPVDRWLGHGGTNGVNAGGEGA